MYVYIYNVYIYMICVYIYIICIYNMYIYIHILKYIYIICIYLYDMCISIYIMYIYSDISKFSEFPFFPRLVLHQPCSSSTSSGASPRIARLSVSPGCTSRFATRIAMARPPGPGSSNTGGSVFLQI